MKTDEALRELSMHLMQCGALMPIDWVTTHGEGSRFMEAYGEAMCLLKLREQGLLAELPCRPGDTVYVINKKLSAVFESEVVYLKIRGANRLKNVIKTRWVGPYGNESIRKWGFRHFGKYILPPAGRRNRRCAEGNRMGLADYFDPNNIRLVDKHCKGCAHLMKISGMDYSRYPGDTGYCCNYAGDADHSRPCPAGEGCTVKKAGKRKKEGIVIL